MDRQDYLERVYTGLIGKTIGVQLGGPVEGWTRERILETYGPSDGYIVEYQDFASDDDLNGPMFFYRTLEDEGLLRQMRRMDVIGSIMLPMDMAFFGGEVMDFRPKTRHIKI